MALDAAIWKTLEKPAVSAAPEPDPKNSMA